MATLPAVFGTIDDFVQNERLLNRLRTAEQLGHLGGEGGARRRAGFVLGIADAAQIMVELFAQVGFDFFVGLADFGAQLGSVAGDIAGVQVFLDVFGDRGSPPHRRRLDDFCVQDFRDLRSPAGRKRPWRCWSRWSQPGRRLGRPLGSRSRRSRPLSGWSRLALLLLRDLPQQLFQILHDTHEGRPPAVALVAIDLRISVSAWTFRSLK